MITRADCVRCLLCMAIVCLCGISGFAQSSTEFDSAVTQFRAGDYGAAAESFARIDAASPGTTDAQLYRAKCLVHLQNFPGAEQSLWSYVEAHRDSSDALYMLGFVLNREDRPADSLKAYTNAAAIARPTADDLKIVGLDYVLLNDYADAIKWLEKAVSLDNKNKDAWYYLGRAYYTQSQLIKAKQAFVAALELDPHDVKAENGIGLVFESSAKPAEAIAAYQKAIAWQKDDLHKSEQPYVNLGSLLLEQGRITDAIQPLETAVAIAPENAYCRLRLGTAYFRAAQLEKAKQELEKAAELDPENATVHYQLGRVYKEMHQMEKAKAEFEKTEKLQDHPAKQSEESKP